MKKSLLSLALLVIAGALSTADMDASFWNRRNCNKGACAPKTCDTACNTVNEDCHWTPPCRTQTCTSTHCTPDHYRKVFRIEIIPGKQISKTHTVRVPMVYDGCFLEGVNDYAGCTENNDEMVVE